MLSLSLKEAPVNLQQSQPPQFCFLSSTLNPKVRPDIWIKLSELPSPYAHDEALLICQHSPSTWIVWIPDHGEAIMEIQD
jgi:hypothetical protein